MRRCELSIAMFAVIYGSGCATYTGGSVTATTPLAQSLPAYSSMAVQFVPGVPEYQEGLDFFRPFAMAQIKAANVAANVIEATSGTEQPSADVSLSIVITDYLKSNVGVWVRGAMANQAKIIMAVTLIDLKTGEPLTAGAVAGWTVHNESDEEVSKRAAANLRRFLKGEYAAIGYDETEYIPYRPE